MANLPNIIVNDSFTIADARNLQKHLIEKLFTSSKVLPDRIYETQEATLSFVLDFYVKNKAGITNEEVYRLAKMADHHKDSNPHFYIDYSTDYNDANQVPNLAINSKNYVAQTYLADNNVDVFRKYIAFIPIDTVGTEINSTIFGDVTIPVVLNFQSFRFSGVDTFKFSQETSDIVAWYVANFTLVNLFEFEYYDRTSKYFQTILINAKELLDVIQ